MKSKLHLMQLRLRRVGNSLGVVLPKKALDVLGVEHKEGVKLTVERLPDGEGLALRHTDANFEKKLAILRDSMRRYKNALRELAK